MRIPTNEITGVLLSHGIQRENAPPFGDAGYRESNGGWLVIQEGYTWQDTEHLIEDCADNECYQMADIIKKYADEKAKKGGS
jgi:hypothetical protein